MVENVIECHAVHKSYKSDIGKRKKIALRDFSLQVSKGEVFGVIGPNGAGKSTALKILMGFVKPDRGSVLLANQSPDTPESHQHVGFLPETNSLYSHLSLLDHLRFAARVASIPIKQAAKRIEKLVELVDLAPVVKTPIKKYSKGMTQRATLAFALLHEPEILILDEPMSGLDPLGRQLVVDIIRDYNSKGNTILFCSHILTDVERICHRIGIMTNGRIAATITPSELNENQSLPDISSGQTPLETFFFKTINESKS